MPNSGRSRCGVWFTANYGACFLSARCTRVGAIGGVLLLVREQPGVFGTCITRALLFAALDVSGYSCSTVVARRLFAACRNFTAQHKLYTCRAHLLL